MSIFHDIKDFIAFRKATKPNVQAAQYGIGDLMFSSQGRYRPSDAKSLVADHNKSWVYICASRNAETIAGIPLRVYVRGGTRSYYGRRALGSAQKKHLEFVTRKGADDVEEITENHPLLDLLTNVNSELTQSELMEWTVTYEEIAGDAYWYIEPGSLGVPAAIWPLMSQYVKVVRDKQGQLVGYLYGKSEMNRVALDAAEVIHFRYPNPNDPDYGLSPLAAAFGAATLLEAEEDYLRNVYDYGGMPEVGLVVKSDLTKEQREQLYVEWKQRYGSKRRGEKAIILQGDMDVKTWGYPPKDVGNEFIQKFSREEIAGAFGVPLTMLQLNEASRAGAEAGHYAYMAFTIQPKLRRIEQKLNERLCPLFDDRLFVAFDNCVPEDKEFRLKEIQTHLNTKMTTINEERAIDGLGPVAWGEEPVQAPAPVVVNGNGDGNNNGEPKKSFVKSASSEFKSFTDMLESHIVDMARDVDKRLKDADS